MSPTMEGGPAIAVWDGAAGVLHVTVRTDRYEQALARLTPWVGHEHLAEVEAHAAKLAACDGSTVETWLDRLERLMHAEDAARAARWRSHICEHPARSRMHAAYDHRRRARARRRHR